MSRNIDQEIADMRQELRDLEEAIARQDPPLAPHTRAIAEGKIATIRGQIAAIKPRNEASTCPVRMKQRPRLLLLMAETPHCTDQPQHSQTRLAMRPLRRDSDRPSYITSIEVWAARPLVGLCTR
jgi:hypothetical protein